MPGEKQPFVIPRLVWPVLVLFGLLVFNWLFTPNFMNLEFRDGRLYGSLIDILDRSAPLMIVALGMTLVIATGGVDLSVGAVMAIAGAVAAGIISGSELSVLSRLAIPSHFAIAMAAAVLAGCLAGLANGSLVTFLKIQPIVATLVLMVAGRGIAQLLVQGQVITYRDPVFAFLGNGSFGLLPISFPCVVGIYVLSFLLARGTAFGLFVEAVGDNPTASRYAGVPINQIKLIVYAISGACAGVAGLIVSADIMGADANSAGMYMELDAILAVVLGGTALSGGRFSLVGTIVGALLIQTLTTTILTQGFDDHYTLIVKALVIVLVCLLQANVLGRSLASLRQRRRPA